MALTGTTNTAANTALRYLTQNSAAASGSLAKLSSGSRIVKASDDAASLAVGTKVKADVTALKQASVNAAQASSLLQVADGGLSRISDILLRMKALSVQASSGSVTDNERAYLDTEFTALRAQIDDIAGQTKFNNTQLLNGNAGKSITATGTGLSSAGVAVQISGNVTTGTITIAFDGTDTFTLTDANSDQHTIQIAVPSGPVIEGSFEFAAAGVTITLNNLDKTAAISADNTVTLAGAGSLDFQVGVDATNDKITVNIDDVDTTALGIASAVVSDVTSAQSASAAIDTALQTVNTARANVGSLISRFEFVSQNLSTSVENLDAARSTLMDVDMAQEMSKFTSSQVLMQASVAMLAQANQMPQGLLRLLS